MEGNQNNEAIHLMDDELLPQGQIKVTKNTENVEVKKENIKMMQGDVGYDVSPPPVDPLLWVPEEIETILKEDFDCYKEDENVEKLPISPKLLEENVDSQIQNFEDIEKIIEKDRGDRATPCKLNVDPTTPLEDTENETEINIEKLLIKEGILTPGEGWPTSEEVPDEDKINVSEVNQKLCEELLQDDHLVEDVMQKIKLMEERQEQLSASLEAVAEHAARNEAYMEKIYSRSSEQLEDLLSAINSNIGDEAVSVEEDELEEKAEE